VLLMGICKPDTPYRCADLSNCEETNERGIVQKQQGGNFRGKTTRLYAGRLQAWQRSNEVALPYFYCIALHHISAILKVSPPVFSENLDSRPLPQGTRAFF
jgi:hypothetical protein